jgi:hyperosmotically inducible periplasmic protein
MYKILGTVAAALIGLSVIGWGVATRGQQDPAPQDGGAAAKAGEKLDELGRAIRRSLIDAEDTVRDGLNRTGGTVRDGFARTKESVQGMGVVPRVYGRLHWDKALHACQLVVKAEGGAVTIRGTVPDEAAKAKAISLARDTFGVTRVIAQLRILAPSIDAPSPETTGEPRTTIEPTTTTAPKTPLEPK